MTDFIIKRNVNTQQLSTIKIGGIINYFFDIFTKKGLKEAYAIINKSHMTYYVIGGCSKILFPDHFFRDALVRISNNYIIQKEHSVLVGAGTSLKKLSSYMIALGYVGFEGLLSIPGNISGALINNAGANGNEISDTLISVTCFKNGKFIKLLKKDLIFSYRNSSLKNKDYIIYEAEFLCKSGDKDIIRNRAIFNTKRRIVTQPQNVLTLGSTFKNIFTTSISKDLDSLYVKGVKIGDLEISKKHVNFIINIGEGSQKNFLNILVILRTLVYNKFKYVPENEVIILRW